MVELHYVPGAASLVVHILFEELGVPYALRLVERDAEGRSPDGYLRVNPHGRVPAVVDDGVVLTEATAICLHYTDLHPAADLAPAAGTPERAQWYRWHCYLTNTVQPAFLRFFYPERYSTDAAAHAAVEAAAAAELAGARTFIADALEPGPYLLGDRLTSADLYLCMLTRWGRRLPARFWDEPRLARHFRSVADRPSARRAWADEGLDREGEPA